MFSVNYEAGNKELDVIKKGFAILKGEKLNV